MKKFILFFSLLTLLVSPAITRAAEADAVAADKTAAAPAVAAPAVLTIDQRISDLEAYVNNGARGTAAPSNISGPGPGHNGWQMVATALVLFMTLPGLALFYGGLVRRKNVLSVLAQCLGIAGLVSILWWLCGYSIAFHPGKPFWGGFDWALLRGVDSKIGRAHV